MCTQTEIGMLSVAISLKYWGFLSHLPYSVSGILASTQQVIHPSFFINADMRKQEQSLWTLPEIFYLRRVFTTVRFELNTFLIFVGLTGSPKLEWTKWFFCFGVHCWIPKKWYYWWSLNSVYFDKNILFGSRLFGFTPKRLFSFAVFGSSSIQWCILDCVCSGTLIIAWIIHCIVFGGTNLREVAPL